MSRHAAALLLLVAAACSKGATPSTADSKADPAAAAAQANLPPPLTIAPAQESLLFSFVDETGAVRSVDKVEDVPPARRQNVMVVDLSRSPEERQADRYVYFADLTTKDPEGKYRAYVVSRYRAPSLAQQLPGDAPAQDGSSVVVYSATWCGYCKKTKAFLKERHIPFKEKDVEAEPGAEQELQAKARKAGVRVSGVPVTDFMGSLVVGFDQPKLEELIAQSKGK